KQIRVVFETQDLRILLWLARDQLHRTPQRSVRLGFGARTLPAAPLAEEPAEALPRGVTLEPGARLRVSGTYEGRTYVKAGASLWGGAVDVEGWIPGDTPIGLTFVATAGAASRKDAGKTWTLEGTANVLSSPGGKPIARFRSSTPDSLLQTLTEVGPSRGWLREVVFRGEGLAVRGFIAKNKLDDAGGLALMGRGRGGEPMVVSGPSQLIEIPRGTCLYDGLRGAVIGVTRVAFQHTVSVPEEDQGWRQLPLADGFSYEPWVRLADVRPGELGKLKAAPALPLELGKWGCPE